MRQYLKFICFCIVIHVSTNYHWAKMASGVLMFLLPGTHRILSSHFAVAPLRLRKQVDDLALLVGA